MYRVCQLPPDGSISHVTHQSIEEEIPLIVEEGHDLFAGLVEVLYNRWSDELVVSWKECLSEHEVNTVLLEDNIYGQSSKCLQCVLSRRA